MGGRYTVCLSVAHTLLIIWGYAVTAHTDVVHQTGTLIMSYPDVLMATVGLGLFVAVGVTSARAARRRLALRDVALHPPVHLSRDRAGLQPPVRDRGRLHQQRTRALAVVGALHRGGRAAGLVSAARPGRTVPLRYPLRVARVVRENADTVSVYVSGARDRPAAGRIRAVLPMAIPDPRAVVGGKPLLALGGPAAGHAAHHGQDRAASTAANCSTLRPRHARPGRGAVRGDDPAHGGAAARCC